MKRFIARQGDVVLVQVDAIPDDAVPCSVSGDVVLAFGETTGHAHRFAGDTVTPLAKGGVWSPTAERYIQALDGAVLRHEEHGEIAIPKGKYRVIQQRI